MGDESESSWCASDLGCAGGHAEGTKLDSTNRLSTLQDCKLQAKPLGDAAASVLFGLAVADSRHHFACESHPAKQCRIFNRSRGRGSLGVTLHLHITLQCSSLSTVSGQPLRAPFTVSFCLSSHLDTPPAHDAQESRTANDTLQRPSRMQRSTSSRCCCGRHVPPLPWGAPQQSARARPSVRRASATPARASVDDARSETEGSSWPRRAQPDDAKSGGPGRSYDDAGVTASVDEAQLAKNRETFLLRLASLGFGVRLKE